MSGVPKGGGEVVGEFGGVEDEEVDDAVVVPSEEFGVDAAVLGVGLDVGDVGDGVGDVVEGDGVDEVSLFGEEWDEVLSHGAGGADDEDALLGGHAVWFLVRVWFVVVVW